MDDLISRKNALDEIHRVYEYEFPTASGAFDEFVTMIIPNILQNLPSVDPERTAKVINHKYSIGTSLNIVGSPTIGYEYICDACKKKVLSGDDYCSHCGVKLDWSDDE